MCNNNVGDVTGSVVLRGNVFLQFLLAYRRSLELFDQLYALVSGDNNANLYDRFWFQFDNFVLHCGILINSILATTSSKFVHMGSPRLKSRSVGQRKEKTLKER